MIKRAQWSCLAVGVVFGVFYGVVEAPCIMIFYVVMGTFVFHAWGLGFWGRMGPAGNLVIPVVLYVLVQVPFSVLWLRRFEFGPMEWLWRALTYGHMPAMRRATGTPLVIGG